MEANQITLVKNSWKIIQAINPVLFGDVFYTKLFMTAPKLRHLFTRSKDEQSMKLIDMLSLVVARLERLDEVSNEVRQLGLRHAGYGVKPEDYAIVGDALLWTLQTALGNDWSVELNNAWKSGFNRIADMMMLSTRTGTNFPTRP